MMSSQLFSVIDELKYFVRITLTINILTSPVMIHSRFI